MALRQATLSRRRKAPKANIPRRGPGARAPAGRLHRDQGRGRRRVERRQAWWLQTPGLAQGPHRDRQAIPGNPGGRVHHRRGGGRSGAARVARPDPARPGDRRGDSRGCLRHPQGSRSIAARGAAVVQPRKNAKPWKAVTARGRGPQRGVARLETLRPDRLATMGRILPPQPCRDPDPLRQTAGQSLPARDFDRRVAAFRVRGAALDGFTTRGRPLRKSQGKSARKTGRPLRTRSMQRSHT